MQVVELPDMALGAFHNALYRSAAEQIVDDHGIRLGSLGSDIFQGPDDSFNEYWTVTDRGPNGLPSVRTFVAPQFNPVIMNVRVTGDRIQILRALPILDASGLPVTGLPNVAGFDEVPWNFNATSQNVPYNPNGLDTEGLVRTRGGDFWLVDEYSPSLVHVGQDGRIIDRFVPVDSRLATTVANSPNYRVRKSLPKILNFRRQNRGFESLALSPDGTTLYFAVQGPLDYPTAALGRLSRNVRIFRFDIRTEQVTGEFVYVFDEVCAFSGQPAGCTLIPGDMKISSMVAVNATTLLVDERTDPIAKIYRVDLPAARSILGSAWDDVVTAPNASTPSLETLANPSSQGIAVLPKTLIVDTSAFPNMPTKIEGIALPRGDILTIANDNDFGMTDLAAFDARGRITTDTKAKSQLIFIELASPLR